jgi:DNA-directed RNA polymerase specialized sigma24 family protein
MIVRMRTRPLEQQVLARVREDEPGAVRYLHARYGGEVHRCALRVVRDEHAATEVTRLVFAGVAAYKDGEGPLAAWLERAARDAAAEWVRRSSRPSGRELPAAVLAS